MGLFDKISYDGIGRDVRATFKHSTLKKGTNEGQPVKISANDTVALCGDGDAFHGVVESIEKKFCTVILTGFHEFTYKGTAPTVGYSLLTGAGTGKVKVKTGSRSYLVVNVNTTGTKAIALLA